MLDGRDIMKLMRNDRHHILFPRKPWETYTEGASLRGTNALIPLMDRNVHNELHRNVPIVPLLGFNALYTVYRGFQTTGDTFQDIARLQSLIDRASDNPKAHEIERGLGDLAIHALDLQIPFLKEGMQ